MNMPGQGVQFMPGVQFVHQMNMPGPGVQFHQGMPNIQFVHEMNMPHGMPFIQIIRPNN